MAVGATVWLVLLALIVLIWASRHVVISQASREQIPLEPDSYDGPPADPPRVSVLIAAKDEEDNIEPCVRSMLLQDYPNFELIVINDRSQDRTPQILERLAAEDGRLRVVHVKRLRDGWFGKNNAMREGVSHATGEWLCFSDADCRQTSARTLTMAVRKALENKIDFLSVLPSLETRGLWERVIQPVCGGIMVFWFPPRRVNNPRSATAYANGAFMLMRRSTYERIGGHERVKTRVNEDMHMARAAKEAGLRLFVAPNRGLYRTRMYHDFPAMWRGWSRIFYGCFGTYPKLAISLAQLLIISVSPWISLFLALGAIGLGLAGPDSPWRAIAWLSAVAVAVSQTVLWRYYKLSQADPWLAPTYVVGAVVGLGMLVNALLKVNGRTTTTWRGTTYRGLRREDVATSGPQECSTTGGARPGVSRPGPT